MDRVRWLVKQAKQGRSNVGQPMRVHGPAHRNPAAGRSRDEWFWMQLTVSSSGFCLLAVARCRLEGGPRMLLDTRLQQAGWKTRQTMLKRNVR